MGDMYSLEYLIETFSRHAIEEQHNKTIYREQHKKDHPNDPEPAYFKETFSLSMVFATICSEILKIKQRTNE